LVKHEQQTHTKDDVLVIGHYSLVIGH